MKKKNKKKEKEIKKKKIKILFSSLKFSKKNERSNLG